VPNYGTVSSLWSGDPKAESIVVVAHGAGNDMHAPFLADISRAFAGAGFLCVRFNFIYKEQGRRAPDRTPVLEATWRAVLAHTQMHLPNAKRLILAGKSMGGRIASMVVAQDAPTVSGLLFFGYPLHPAGRTDRLRCAHLLQVRCPMLFIQGTRDPLCDLTKLRKVLQDLPNATLHEVIDGDHSFKVLKKSQRDPAEVFDEIVEVSKTWMCGLGRE